MKITAVEMTSFQKRKAFTAVLMLCMFAGIIAGTISVMADVDRQYVIRPLFNQNMIKSKDAFLNLFLKSFIPLELMLLFQMICGFFAIGQPFCVFTLFFRGLAGGIGASLIYAGYGFKGIFIILAVLFPVLLFNMYILVLGARESIKSSNLLMYFTLGKHVYNKSGIKIYFIKYIVLTFFAAGCSLFDSILVFVFKVFNY